MEEFLEIMIAESSPTSAPPSVSTLVFFDLETTGLPTYVGKKNVHITELSLVAIDRNDFEDESSEFRVMNKLSVCIRPRSVVSHSAMCVTGLHNSVLDTQQPFNQSVVKLLEAFFSRLRPPVCLLAHNGRKYDFPVLQAELKRLDFSLPPDILCADTLEAFRTLGLIAPDEKEINSSLYAEQKEKDDRNSPTSKSEINSKAAENYTNICCEETRNENLTDADIEQLLSDNIEVLSYVDLPEASPQISVMETEKMPNTVSLNQQAQFGVIRPKTGMEINNNIPCSLSNTVENIFPQAGILTSPFANGCLSPGYGEHTPTKYSLQPPKFDFYNGKQDGNETSIRTGNLFQMPHNKKVAAYPHQVVVPAKRKLFDICENPSEKKINTNSLHSMRLKNSISTEEKKSPKRVQYSLEKLYIHYFGRDPPGSHHAESDCINLSKVCHKVSKVFLKWLDMNSSPFCATDALW